MSEQIDAIDEDATELSVKDLDQAAGGGVPVAGSLAGLGISNPTAVRDKTDVTYYVIKR